MRSSRHKLVLAGLIVLVAVYGSVTASAALVEYTLTPPRYPDLRDLDHHRYYTWGIDSELNGEMVGATLVFHNIRDWTVEDNDHLFVHLLDSVASGYNSYTDPEPYGVSDYFDGQGQLVLDWTDPVGGTSVGIELTVDLDPVILAQYSADGNFGFGFDPDCHYFNDGVELRVVTEVVPEPSTLLLLGGGFAGLGILQARRIGRKRS